MRSASSRVAALALILVTATACVGEDSSVPSALGDGSAARPPPVILEGVEGPSILTRTRVLQRDSVGPGTRARRCLEAARAPANAVVVERIGVSGVSVTAVGRDRRTAYGCDASATRLRDGSPWCGHAYGRLEAGRLRDPRLSVTCRSHDDEPLGFAWVQPDPGTAYIVVGRRGYIEVYPVAGRVPVRVVTDAVDENSARATFAVSEHAADGRRLAAYELDAWVSG